MDRVDDAVLGKEPELIAPFLRVAFCVLGVVIIDEVGVEDVVLEGRVKLCVAPVIGKRHFGGLDSVVFEVTSRTEKDGSRQGGKDGGVK